VDDLSPYYAESDELPSLKINSLKERGADRDQGSQDSFELAEV